MFPRCNSTLSAYLKNPRLSAYLKNPGLPESLKNPRLSAYLNNPRLRTQASVTLAVAAAAASIGAASASAGAAPWSAPLNSMVVGIHPDSHATSQQAAPADGKSPVAAIQALRPLPAVHHVAPAKPAAPAAPARPYTVYDSVTPTEIPSGEQVATYANGGYQASWSELRGRHNVLWIDTDGSDPGCNALDVEPGDATPSGAAQWVRDRLTEQPHATAIVYTMLSEWQQVKDAIGSLPSQMQDQVQYWIADPTGVPHIVPGSTATQWYWGPDYDITAALPQFNR